MTPATTSSGAKDATLIAQIRAGSHGAMEALYDRYSSIVYAVAVRVLADTSAAEDVVQEIFMQLWRHPQSFDSNRGSMGAWLAVISRHRSIDALRKRKPETDLEDVVLSFEAPLQGDAERKSLVSRVRRAMSLLPAEQQRAMEMAFFEGLTHSEIAARTGEPLGTIKTRIRAALSGLRKGFSAARSA